MWITESCCPQSTTIQQMPGFENLTEHLFHCPQDPSTISEVDVLFPKALRKVALLNH